MSQVIKQYSQAFKRHVVQEYEQGASIEQLRTRYGIGGKTTIQRWIRQYGREGTRHQLLRIQTPEEADQLPRLRQEIRQLQEALAQTVLERIALEQQLACYQETFGTELVKKNAPSSSTPSTKPPSAKDTP